MEILFAVGLIAWLAIINLPRKAHRDSLDWEKHQYDRFEDPSNPKEK